MTLRERFLSRERVLGMIVNLDSIDLIELLAAFGLDFLVVDCEHSPIGEERLSNMVRAGHGRGVPVFVRVRSGDPATILGVCDIGVDGIIIPHVDDAEQATVSSRAARYPPEGDRGLHPVNPASGWGVTPLADHIRAQNEGITVIVQIETAVAVERVEEIAAVPTVDALMVGPLDLSASLGVAGQIGHPDVKAALDRTFRATAATHAAGGSVVGSADDAADLAARGGTFFIMGVSGILRAAVRREVDLVRSTLAA